MNNREPPGGIVLGVCVCVCVYALGCMCTLGCVYVCVS